MPMELLKEVARLPLPATFTRLADIDRLRVLRAAGLIAAMLPSPGAQGGLARVMAITPQGRMALAETESALSEPATMQQVSFAGSLTGGRASSRRAKLTAPRSQELQI